MLMKVKTAALFGVTLVLLAGSAAHAATLSFNFVFTNASNGGGTVTGVVEGLIDNNTTAATSVRVLSNTLGFGLGEYVGSPTDNSWSVLNGQITKVTFYSYGGLNSLPAVTSASLAFLVDSRLLNPISAGLKNDPVQTRQGPSELQFTPVPSVTAVPLPGALPLFATTVAALAYVARRKRKLICAQSVA